MVLCEAGVAVARAAFGQGEPAGGYLRVVGECRKLGVRVSAASVRTHSPRAGPRAPTRASGGPPGRPPADARSFLV